MAISKPLTFMLKDDGKVPNNPALPVLGLQGRSRCRQQARSGQRD
jgi:uncharacterized protein YjlB